MSNIRQKYQQGPTEFQNELNNQVIFGPLFDDCSAKHVLNFTIQATAQVIQYQGGGVQNFEKCCSDHKWKPSNNSHHFVSILANMAAAFDPEHGSLLTGVGCLNHTLKYRCLLYSAQTYISRTKAGLDRTVQLQQEQTSPNLERTIKEISVQSQNILFWQQGTCSAKEACLANRHCIGFSRIIDF